MSTPDPSRAPDSTGGEAPPAPVPLPPTRVVNEEKKEEQEEMVQQGSLRIPKRLLGAAAAAGLGSEEKGLYGHIGGAAGAMLNKVSDTIESGSGAGAGLDPSGNLQLGNKNGDLQDDVWKKSGTYTGDDRFFIDMIEKEIINRYVDTRHET